MRVNLAYTDCHLDRASHLRADARIMEARLNDAASRFVPVFEDRNLVIDNGGLRAAVLAASDGSPLLRQPQASAFLGIDRDDAAWFAIEVNNVAAADPACRAAGRFVDLRRVSAGLPANDSAVLAYARGLMHWHRRQRFCGNCGGPTISRHGGHARVCSSPDCALQHFPRTDPAILVLVTRSGPGEEACLLARQAPWPAGLVSTLAGFVEPGESMEEAVVREIHEEVRLTLRRVRYRGSQPWPFPASLMLAFHAEADPADDIHLDGGELEMARWFTRRDLAQVREMDLKLPPRDSIGRMLIEDWWHGGEE